MVTMFSKIDIGSIKRKRTPKRVRNVIKREVLSFELADARRAYKQKTALADLNLLKPEAVLIRQPQFLRVGSFALAGFILIAALQSVSYLSSAHKASGEILGAATSA